MTSIADLARQLGVPAWRVQLVCRRLGIEIGATRSLEPGVDEADVERITEWIRGG